MRIVIHAGNTEVQIETLATLICEWAKEMLDIETKKVKKNLPKAISKIYSLMADADVKRVQA